MKGDGELWVASLHNFLKELSLALLNFSWDFSYMSNFLDNVILNQMFFQRHMLISTYYPNSALLLSVGLVASIKLLRELRHDE